MNQLCLCVRVDGCMAGIEVGCIYSLLEVGLVDDW